MQRSIDGNVQGQSAEWRLSFGAVRVHNSHLQGGKSRQQGCGICEKGLGGAMAKIEGEGKSDSEDEVVEGDGVDEKANTSPSYSDWADYWNES